MGGARFYGTGGIFGYDNCVDHAGNAKHLSTHGTVPVHSGG